jgi:hypothetical protein
MGSRNSGSSGLAALDSLLCFAVIKTHVSHRHLPYLSSSPQSRWCGPRPQPGNQHQDFLEHSPWHGDLGQLERDIAAMAHHVGADLDELLAQAGSDHGSAALSTASVRMKLPRL